MLKVAKRESVISENFYDCQSRRMNADDSIIYVEFRFSNVTAHMSNRTFVILQSFPTQR